MKEKDLIVNLSSFKRRSEMIKNSFPEVKTAFVQVMWWLDGNQAFEITFYKENSSTVSGSGSTTNEALNNLIKEVKIRLIRKNKFNSNKIEEAKLLRDRAEKLLLEADEIEKQINH